LCMFPFCFQPQQKLLLAVNSVLLPRSCIFHNHNCIYFCEFSNKQILHHFFEFFWFSYHLSNHDFYQLFVINVDINKIIWTYQLKYISTSSYLSCGRFLLESEALSSMTRGCLYYVRSLRIAGTWQVITIE